MVEFCLLVGSNRPYRRFVVPTLEELIEACEKKNGCDHFILEHSQLGWFATIEKLTTSKPTAGVLNIREQRFLSGRLIAVSMRRRGRGREIRPALQRRRDLHCAAPIFEHVRDLVF